jgi:GNAT superfamily N-acetyltransferase
MSSGEFSRSTREERAAALESMVLRGIPVGVLAYSEGEPVAWCSIAPRQTYRGLEKYRKLSPIDDKTVWSIVCFYVDRRYRRRGMTFELLKAAVAYAASQGASIVEGYPVEPDSRSYTYMGRPATFLDAGFHDVTPEGRERLVMRYMIDQDAPR